MVVAPEPCVCSRAPGARFYDPVKGSSPVRGLAVVTRSAKRRAEQEIVVDETS